MHVQVYQDKSECCEMVESTWFIKCRFIKYSQMVESTWLL